MSPSADYRPTRFTALTTFCDGIYFENIIRLLGESLLLFNVNVANAVACYQRWQRNSTAVNMASVWKRSITQ